jgi:uncharacterized protein YbbC (DUF1343 family)
MKMILREKPLLQPGTDTPFEVFGAPWINAEELSEYLNNRGIKGVKFMPVRFTPDSSTYKNRLCQGVKIILVHKIINCYGSQDEKLYLVWLSAKS